MAAMIGYLLLLFGVTQVTIAVDPCSSYSTLNAANRLETFTGQSPVRCDRNDISPGWYRFTGVAGRPQMPTQCVQPTLRCGTHAPGWLNGAHPTVAQGVVSREVCYHWSNNCCRWKNNIKVKNCGAFYVYELQKPPACSLRYCVASNNPCSNYKTLGAADRLETFTGQSPLRCDRNDITPGWYRFTGVAGRPQMPTQCVNPTRRCGTHAPGWLNGNHPSVADGEVTREVCYHWSNNCCRWKNNIKVKNCGAFYVYELQKTPACSLRYCVASNPCSNYKSLNAASRLETYTGQSPLRCDRNDITPGWYRFTGVAGRPQMPTQCVNPTRRCGTHAPGWLNGNHPTVAQGVVSREVCYHWSNNCCRWKNNIKVKNCGAFYVYELQKTPACSLRYCVASNPCSNYKSLNAASRLETYTGQSPLRCDRNDITPGWYRFTGVAGRPQMPTQCVQPTRRCGTHAPGWLNGNHPTVAQGVVSREVCYHWSSNCCRWKNNIKVKNCGAFYVYELQKTPACSLRYCVASNDPCSNYKSLNAVNRLETYTGQSPLRCDRNDITPGWYRFTGVAGRPQMPTQCVQPTRRCGTHAPGWLNGNHPTVAQGVVSREVCYHWSSNCCRWKNNIKVKNCGAFYVYELQKTPACSLRYCVASNDPCSNYKSLNAVNRLETYTGQSPLRCDRNDITPGWYRFTGVAGRPQMPTQCVQPTRRCGTHAPGWLNGNHPTVAQGVVSREVCYHWSSNCCRWKNNIKVKNCGAFYVYELQKTPACSLRYCVASNDPCSNYKSLNAVNRLETYTGQSPLRCDRNDITPGWYRFTGVAGRPQMPTQCVQPTRRCGTHAPGWLNGNHPTVAQGVVSREVCYHWSSNCCRWKNNIKVKNCGAFYVYELQKTPACSLRYCVASNDPCSNYKNLNAVNRLETFTGQSPLRCDRNDITPGWYRFTGVAGRPQMPTQCVQPTNRCGTHAPGWLNGAHPTVAQGVVSREVCYHWSSNCCRWKNNIKVKNCGAFYVYELQKTPACSLRYCVASPNDPCSNYKSLDAANRLTTYTSQSPLRCDRNDINPGWYRFTGVPGNPKMPTQCPSTQRCSTHAPGWLNGAHPTVAEGVVSREVCYHWVNNCCRWKNNIKVKNCGAFYVYELQKTPACSLRYCAVP